MTAHFLRFELITSILSKKSLGIKIFKVESYSGLTPSWGGGSIAGHILGLESGLRS